MIVCSLCHRCYDDSIVSCTEAGHPPLSETRPGSPEMIDGYRLDFLLESVVNGGIYRASQTASGRSCRIKILSADERSSQRFLDEANLAGALFHPNVVDVYEVSSLKTGEVFVVAEDPDGESLRELLNSVGVPHLLTSIQVVRQTAEALHVLHLKGLTHRSVNPENIILTTDAEHRLLARIKDIDFGGLIERSIVSNKFFIDSAIDSLKYFAPEQCSGEAVSMKTDVYGLGVVLYEMLAGIPPFEAEKAAALIDKHKNQRPPEIRIDNFELRMLLSHTLMESLTKRPDKRQSSANAFARQMRHIEQLATHVSTPPPAGVVPPAPPRTAAVVTAFAAAATRPAILHPAAVIETRKVTYQEYTQPVTAVIEHEPASLFKGQIEAPCTAVRDESEPMAASHPEDHANDLIPIPNLASEVLAIGNLVKERSSPLAARPSRLRIKRKKLHPKIATPSLGIPENKPLTVGEAAPVKPEQVQAVPVQLQSLSVPMPVAIAARRAESEKPAAVPLPNKPAKIEWDQPEDDIPSEADVLEVLAKEQMTEIPVEHAELEKTAFVRVVNAEPERIPVVPDFHPEPEKTAVVPVVHPEPEKTAVVPVVHAEPEKTVPVPVVHAKPEKAAVFSVRKPDRIKIHPPAAAIPRTPNVPAPIVDIEPEEITLVSPPSRRIRIDWGQPRAQQNRLHNQWKSARGRDEGGFFPTILGGAGTEGSIDIDQRDSMFSAHYPSSRARFSAHARSLVLASGGVAALIALFFFGDDIVRSYAPAGDPDRSTEARTITKEGSLPQPMRKEGVTAAKPKVVKNVRKAVPENDVALKAGVPNEIPKAPTLSRNSGKTPDTGKIKGKTEPAKKSADKKPLSGPNKTANATRPRFVKEPKR